MTTETVLTDEQIVACGSNSEINGPYSFARAIEQAVLQAYESQLLRLLVNIRFAAGDDGKRMQDELVEHIAALRKDAERYRFCRSQTGPAEIHIHGVELGLAGPDLDEAMDHEMEAWKS